MENTKTLENQVIYRLGKNHVRLKDLKEPRVIVERELKKNNFKQTIELEKKIYKILDKQNIPAAYYIELGFNTLNIAVDKKNYLKANALIYNQ